MPCPLLFYQLEGHTTCAALLLRNENITSDGFIRAVSWPTRSRQLVFTWLGI